MQTLQQYIDEKYGSNMAFAEAMQTTRQHIHKWKVKGYIVIDNAIYKKMRDLPQV